MSDFYNKYPYTDFHELNLDWVIERVKKLTEDWLATHEEWVGVQQNWADTEQAWIDFKAYVENYLANLDVQDEIDHKIDQMVADGSLRTLIQPDVLAQTVSTTTDWLATHITQPTTPAVDTSLSISGAAADALVVGTRLSDLNDITVKEYINKSETYTDINLIFTISGNTVNISGTSTAAEGYNVLDSMIDNFQLEANKSYYFSFLNYDIGHRIIAQIKYQANAGDPWTVLKKFDNSSVKDTAFSSIFTMPASWYKCTVSITAYPGTYDTDTMISITNAEPESTIFNNISNITRLNDCSIKEYMCNDITTTLSGVTYTVNKTSINLSGLSSQTEGLFVIDSIASYPCYLEAGKSYSIKIEGLPRNKHVNITIGYKATDTSPSQPILQVDSQTSRSEYLGSFTVPASYYRLFVSVTTYQGVNYDNDIILSITDFDILHNGMDNLDINQLKNKINTIGYSYSDFERADGTDTNANVTVTKEGSRYLVNGQANATYSYNIIEGNDIFKAGDSIYLTYNKDNTGMYLQVICKVTGSGTEQNLLTTFNNGHYVVTFPTDTYYVRIALVYNNNMRFDHAALYLYINRYETIGSRTYYTSQYNDSLIQTVKAAEKFYGSTVILDSGTYDIVDEFVNYYGATFFSSYSTSNTDGWGLVIGNGMTVRGLSDTVIKCDCSSYVTADNRPDNLFSIFMLSDDCSIENIKLIGANCRYCIHDDWYDKTLNARHIIKNCKMQHTGSGLRCIGGGMVNAGEIIIESCIFSGTTDEVAYHNCVNADAIGSIIIKDCYFENDGIIVSNYGASTLMTPVIISGNSYKHDPVITYIDPDDYGIENMRVIKFNNEIRP